MAELSVQKPEITLRAANSLIEKTMNAAKQKGLPVAVAVVDRGGNLKAFARHDDCLFLPSEVALDKAWTAASFGYPTHAWNELVGDTKIAPLANHPRLMAVGGGYPLKLNGEMVGAIGISGGSYADDMEIAERAILEAEFDAV